MRLPGLAIDRSGLDSKPTVTDGKNYGVFDYEKKGKKRYGFYVTDAFLGIPTDWKFGYRTRKDANAACLKMVSKRVPSLQQRILRDLQRVGHWISVAWFAKKYSVTRNGVLNAAKSLRNKGLIETERRTKNGKRTYHLRAL